ncbi:MULTISPECIES: SDR family NAD(P)-dependent oxidoreductase [unclassified Halomonas]|uniref:SDR family NAD(P)-dependent oxidoreductase n=1 Tax=unclassified Halomonas TaxID=2609666 RepID=UPI001C97379E|nr:MULTISPECIES: SDR family NAD(P)-dependent oxidoreductase [unclassified Halomonas]MBY5926539.1 SDR family NAD(P)-dependent oxidoreductase [Halomonas sp. DP4Y7-2]MBY6233748.1 SDR family NAD(P)-dependent oxidoreductase [Halomonas sp. DP4Y7-1]
MTEPLRLILITGATGAIGGALAEHYAAPGQHLLLHGRRQDVLDTLATRCRAKGAKVSLFNVTLEDDQARRAWLDSLSATPDLVIMAAGMNTGIRDARLDECTEAARQLMDINLRVPMEMSRQLATAMRRRGHGQLVFVSSLAAWHGLPSVPSYSASKAAIKAYAEALRAPLGNDGVGVTLVMPGYVASDMARAMPGPKPFMWSAERAAKRIAKAVDANRPRVSFPLPLCLATQGLTLLPPAWAQRLLQLFGYGISRK